MSIFNELLSRLFDISNKSAKSFNDELQAALVCLSKFENDQKIDCTKAKEKVQKDKTRMTTLQSIHEDDDSTKNTKSSQNDKARNSNVGRRKRSKDEIDDMPPVENDKRRRKTSSRSEDAQAALDCLDKLESEHQNDRSGAKEKAQKDKTLMTTLQSIHEDDDESSKENNDRPRDSRSRRRVSKKRNKDEQASSPEQDKRQKRNASVKAQSIISKQEQEILKVLNQNGVAFVSCTKLVNVNLIQKMRRDDSSDKKSRRKDDDKEKEENSEPAPPIQIKQEKISLPPEPMDTEPLPLHVVVKQEPARDDRAMPPPLAPIPKPRKALQKEREKEKEAEDSAEEDTGSRRRTTRTRKQTDTMPPPVAPVASARSTRASSRAARPDADAEGEAMPPPEPRPKRTRAKKKVSESQPPEAEVPPDPRPKRTRGKKTVSEAPPPDAACSPDKPRPKRTRRGNNAEKEVQQKTEPPQEKEPESQLISPKEERISQTEQKIDSPVLKPTNDKKKQKENDKKAKNQNNTTQIVSEKESEVQNIALDETRVIVAQNLNATVTLNNMDTTVVLPNGVYNHAPVTPKNICANETVVLETHARETMVLHNQNINDATVVIDKDPKPNVSEDNSLLTDDASEPRTPPQSVPANQPTSAVKVKVQQFEELAARTTRTKTRAMAKIEDQDNHTPPDKIIKPILSQETLTKMNDMIFNGKATQQISSSASKPRAILPPMSKSRSASASKASVLTRQKEAAEESMKKEKEDARKKKEAMLEAKREQQKKKREEKMANAAAAREAAERERKLAMEAAARERMEKQLHADQGKLERMKEQERKKQELARKVAETEERRRAEEQARRGRLADEQRRADILRKKQLEEAEAVKKETIQMAKEIEKRQKEYMEKQKLKLKMHTPHKIPGTPGYYPPPEPVYMADGFQYLHENEEDDAVRRPIPQWSSSKARKHALVSQSLVAPAHIDKLFSVRVHSPDLRDIFPDIDRARTKRTSSAVWHTPPRLPTLAE